MTENKDFVDLVAERIMSRMQLTEESAPQADGNGEKSGSHDVTAPYVIGEKYLVRCVTFYTLGRLVWVGPQELMFEDASHIADTGRFNKALTEGVAILDEVEPYPNGAGVGRGAIVDFSIWNHDLPREVK